MIDLNLDAVARAVFVGLGSGIAAQGLKLVSFLLIEKRINFRRLVETDGAPNMHSAAFAGLATAIGQEHGTSSLEFAVALCFSALVTVDMWNVKRAASHQAEVVDLILDRLRPQGPGAERRPLSYDMADVLLGTALGIGMAMATR